MERVVIIGKRRNSFFLVQNERYIGDECIISTKVFINVSGAIAFINTPTEYKRFDGIIFTLTCACIMSRFMWWR